MPSNALKSELTMITGMIYWLRSYWLRTWNYVAHFGHIQMLICAIDIQIIGNFKVIATTFFGNVTHVYNCRAFVL